MSGRPRSGGSRIVVVWLPGPSLTARLVKRRIARRSWIAGGPVVSSYPPMFAIDLALTLGALSEPALAIRESLGALLATQVEEKANDG